MVSTEPPVHLLPVPTPFPVGPVNVYLLEGRPLTLVDVGPLTDEALVTLTAGLKELGYSLADIEQVAITHAHHDHFGLARRVVELSGAKVLSHAENRYPLENFEAWWDRRMSYLADLVVREGAPPGARYEMDTIRGFGVYATSVSQVTPLRDNEIVHMGEAPWQALHTPGHALGHLCFYQPHSRLLLSGDHLLREITPNPVLETPRPGMADRPRSLPDYVRSLHRIRELDVARVLPGHGEPVFDYRPLVDDILAHHQARGLSILRLLRQRDSTVYQLGVDLFGAELPGVELFLVMSEILGHLDVLELEGKVRRLETQNGALWTVVG